MFIVKYNVIANNNNLNLQIKEMHTFYYFCILFACAYDKLKTKYLLQIYDILQYFNQVIATLKDFVENIIANF